MPDVPAVPDELAALLAANARLRDVVESKDVRRLWRRAVRRSGDQGGIAVHDDQRPIQLPIERPIREASERRIATL